MNYNYYYNRFMAVCPGLYPGEPVTEGWAILDFTEAEVTGGSGIRWTICKSFALRSRQMIMLAPHHSVFKGPDALPAAQPTASTHWRRSTQGTQRRNTKHASLCHDSWVSRLKTVVWFIVVKLVPLSYWRILEDHLVYTSFLVSTNSAGNLLSYVYF